MRIVVTGREGQVVRSLVERGAATGHDIVALGRPELDLAGDTGAIEAAICALASRRGWLPPTVNLETPDPECDLDLIRGEGRTAAPEVILSNSFGFGGINAALVFRRGAA